MFDLVYVLLCSVWMLFTGEIYIYYFNISGTVFCLNEEIFQSFVFEGNENWVVHVMANAFVVFHDYLFKLQELWRQ